MVTRPWGILFVVGLGVLCADGAASGGSYVHVPNGTGNNLSGFDSGEMVSYCVDITTAGNYKILATVHSPSYGANTFYVRMDGSPSAGYVWEFPSNSQAYVTDYVSEKNGADPLLFNLSAGQHTFEVSLREDRARLDKLIFEFDSSASGEAVNKLVHADRLNNTLVGPPTKSQYRAKVAQQSGSSTQTIVRKTYMLAGQPIAMRTVTTINMTQEGNDLYFIYGDHLGSANTLVHQGTAEVVESQRFYPFGEYRDGPLGDMTDRGFTGHMENNYIKLVYMNSRWYDPAIGRFISADTIVPDPTDPQAYNRYAYSLNNPVKFVDPSGHCALIGDFEVERDPSDQDCWDLLDQLENDWGVDIDHEWAWDLEYLKELEFALNSFAELLGGRNVLSDILRESASKFGRPNFLISGTTDPVYCSTGCSYYGYMGFHLDETFRLGQTISQSSRVNALGDLVAGRTTIAHELAHIVLGVISSQAITDYYDLRGWHRPVPPSGNHLEQWVGSNGASPVYL